MQTGIAALYVKPGIGVKPFLYGGGQEGGRRAGTENVLLIVGIGKLHKFRCFKKMVLMMPPLASRRSKPYRL